MRVLLKTLKFISILIIILSVTLFTASLFLKERVAGVLIKSLNNNISTPLKVGSLRLSFLKRFPRASLEMKDVLIQASPDFSHSGFNGVDTDTLLAARSVHIEFRVSDIIRGNYKIERIGIKSGKLILLSDKEGRVNYEVKTNTANNSNEFELNLERIILSDISATYNNLATQLLLRGDIKDGRLKSKFTGKNIDFEAVSSVHISLFQLYNSKITRGIDAGIDIDLNSSGGLILFRRGDLSINDLMFGLTGTISNGNLLDLELTGRNIDISEALKYLPEGIKIPISDYNSSGICKVDAKINGLMSRTMNPHIEINASLTKGRIRKGKSGLTINDLSFSGSFSNGSKNIPRTTSLSVDNISLKLGSSPYSGSFTLNNFENPETIINMKGLVKPGELREFFDMKEVLDGEGSADLNLKLSGRLNSRQKLTIHDFLNLKSEGDLRFNSFGLMMNNFRLSNVTGSVDIRDVISTKDLSLNLNNHNINLNGQFRNLPGWISGREVRLIALATVKSDRFEPAILFNEKNESEDRVKPFSMPENMSLDLTFHIDRIHYRTFTGQNIKGSLSYKPNELTFKSININSLGGIISGNGAIFQNRDKTLMAKGSFNLQNIDINNAFLTFNNFGQSFIKAGNLGGSLSGSLSVLLPMSAFFEPQTGSLTAEGKYTIINGALINFDPIKSLSSYIELSELENISFEKLENDFYIRNNSLYIPQMEVKSTAADLTVNGKHSFDNQYEYHVKIRLSLVLSKKFRTKRTFKSDFGIIEDDGLGRTSLLLKVENKGADIKVGYDMKAAGTEIVKDIREERSSIKTILNEEYGWFKNDSTIQKKEEEKRPRFRITWDERGDSVKTIPEVSPERGTPIKNIFKKK